MYSPHSLCDNDRKNRKHTMFVSGLKKRLNCNDWKFKGAVVPVPRAKE